MTSFPFSQPPIVKASSTPGLSGISLPPRNCPSAVITADGQFRGGKEIPLKPGVDEAFTMGGCEKGKDVIVYKRSGSKVPMQAPRDKWWDDGIKGQSESSDPVNVNAEHPLFILYTSGSTGKPKGIQHSTGGDHPWGPLAVEGGGAHNPARGFR